MAASVAGDGRLAIQFLFALANVWFLLSLTDAAVASGLAAGLYTRTFSVELRSHNETLARKLAEKHGFRFRRHIVGNHFLLERHDVRKRSTDQAVHVLHPLSSGPDVLKVTQQVSKRRSKRDFIKRSKRAIFNFNDPLWNKTWFLNRGQNKDLNVEKVWQKGITGKGVLISFLDDGVEINHPDLKNNHDPVASYDFIDDDDDPTPPQDSENTNNHGTRCAGIVASQEDNGLCSVGIAYESKFGGARMLDGDPTDEMEASSLVKNNQKIHIYSASWGPDDDGKLMEGPGELTTRAFADGVKEGRGGKGSLFIWASGNGAEYGDTCNSDGYTNSIYTLSVGSTDEDGGVTTYAEACSSTLATTFSGGENDEDQREIITTDINGKCTNAFSGTSASAPMAAGVAALVLQANPTLTWRDVQHVFVHSANPDALTAPEWTTNAAKLKANNFFGFGLVDALAAVELARTWSTVPEQRVCRATAGDRGRAVAADSDSFFVHRSDGCRWTAAGQILYVEHVQLSLNLRARVRGEISLTLTSPSGTSSLILDKRPADNSSDGFADWVLMSSHFWGENPRGDWKFRIAAGATTATLDDWTLILWGTYAHPQPGRIGTTGYPPVATEAGGGAIRLADDASLIGISLLLTLLAASSALP